jgi:hypothetical protein
MKLCLLFQVFSPQQQLCMLAHMYTLILVRGRTSGRSLHDLVAKCKTKCGENGKSVLKNNKNRRLRVEENWKLAVAEYKNVSI